MGPGQSDGGGSCFCGFTEGVLRSWGRGRERESAAALSQGVLVKEVFAKTSLGCPQPPEVGDVVAQDFDSFHLLVKVVSFQEVTEL